MTRVGQNRIDLTGQRFGRLFVESFAETRRKKAYWRCKCDCGAITVVVGYSLRAGYSTSCGCFRQEVVVAKNNKHGLARRGAKGRWYVIWNAIMARCYVKTNADFYLYGERGVTVCEEWHDAGKFVAWCEAHEPVGKGMSIDRYPDTNGPYAPWNCRFATATEQSRNRRPSCEWRRTRA